MKYGLETDKMLHIEDDLRQIYNRDTVRKNNKTELSSEAQKLEWF